MCIRDRYKADNPNTKFSDQELLDYQRRGYTYNEKTQRFNKPGSKTVDDPAKKSPLEELEQAKIDTDIKADMDQIKSQRDKDVATRDKSAKKTDDYNQQNYKVIQGSAKLGEKAAEAYMKSKGGKRLYPPPDVKVEDWPSRSGVFDQIWDVDGKLVIVEAKGGSSTLGSRKINGKRHQQGTQTYMEDIIANMEKNPATEKIAQRMQDHYDSDILEIDYVLVRQGFDKSGNLANIKIDKFDISRAE